MCIHRCRYYLKLSALHSVLCQKVSNVFVFINLTGNEAATKNASANFLWYGAFASQNSYSVIACMGTVGLPACSASRHSVGALRCKLGI